MAGPFLSCMQMICYNELTKGGARARFWAPLRPYLQSAMFDPQTTPIPRPSPPSPAETIGLLPMQAPPTPGVRRFVPLVGSSNLVPPLLRELITRGGFTVQQFSRRLGCRPENIYQYLSGRRNNMRLATFLTYVEACGARLYVEFPDPALRHFKDE